MFLPHAFIVTKKILENRIKPAYCNSGGLQEYDPDNDDGHGNCWTDWYSPSGDDIDHVDDDGNTLEG